MSPILQFVVLSLPVVYLSRRNLLHPRSHGFFRFFGWEGMVWLFICNRPYWFTDPFSGLQLLSWLLLLMAIWLVGIGGLLLLKNGKPSAERNDQHLMGFEKTTRLVDTGIYALIRHPLYASLIYLTWGIVLKNPEPELLVLATVCSILFYLTARHDEKECLEYFGNEYAQYMKRSKMFIPFLW